MKQPTSFDRVATTHNDENMWQHTIPDIFVNMEIKASIPPAPVIVCLEYGGSLQMILYIYVSSIW